MTLVDYAAVLALWIGYLGLASLCAWGALRITRSAVSWQRRAAVSLVLAIFFAPSAVGAGHGGGIGPAWIALFQMFPFKLGVVPILVTFVAFFVIGSVAGWLGGRKQ